jgi:hypothetical protein
MRAERNNPNQVYRDFWDWLLSGWHPVWIITLLFGYAYYLITTAEV